MKNDSLNLKWKHLCRFLTLGDILKTFFLIGYTLLLWKSSPAQMIQPVLIDSSNQRIVRFQQNFNAYQWQFLVNTRPRLYRGLFLSITHDFTSSLLNQGEIGKKWKDNQILNLGLDYLLKPNLTLKTGISSLFFIDCRCSFPLTPHK